MGKFFGQQKNSTWNDNKQPSLFLTKWKEFLKTPFKTIESLHGYRKNTAETFRKTEVSARSLKQLRDRTAPIEICGVPVGTVPEQEDNSLFGK